MFTAKENAATPFAVDFFMLHEPIRFTFLVKCGIIVQNTGL